MSRLIRYLRGSVRFRLTGAAPEQCLNALAAARLEFWDIEREDALNLSLCVPAREAERLQRLALRCLCTAEVTEHSGLRAQFGGLLRRPVLLLGLLAAAAATFVLQEFVWTIEVEGNDRLPAGQIVQALEELGIAPGTWGPSIDSPETRNWMLLRMPELAWLAVNRSGRAGAGARDGAAAAAGHARSLRRGQCGGRAGRGAHGGLRNGGHAAVRRRRYRPAGAAARLRI